jgi:CubicO group peptidase (beta-lactamase class C family)
VVGKLVEKVSGQKLEDYFRQHIFAPLQMSDTSYNVPRRRKVYRQNGGRLYYGRMLMAHIYE